MLVDGAPAHYAARAAHYDHDQRFLYGQSGTPYARDGTRDAALPETPDNEKLSWPAPPASYGRGRSNPRHQSTSQQG